MKTFSSLLFLLAVPLLLYTFSPKLYAQQKVQRSQEVENRIKQVETNLVGVIQLEGQKKWNITERMAFYKVPGLSIAVVRDYKIEWAKGYGWADAAEKREVTSETLFQAASISKSLNGVGILKLVQENKLDLKTDINNYLKSWKFPYDSLSKNKKITLSNLLSHTAGLSVHGFRGYAKGEAVPAIGQILNGEAPANNAPIRSQFAPDLRVQYSGGGTTISQLIVMDITGMPYDQYMKKNVLTPMGMTSSFYGQPGASDKISAIIATGHQENGTEVPGKYHVYPEQAAASLWTNPTELSRYIIETQLSLQGKSSKVLSQASTKTRLTPYKDAAALGVFIDTKGKDKYFQHGGANEGFRSQYFGSLENGNGVVVMVNSDNGGIMGEIINSVASVYQWKDFYKADVKKITQLSQEQLKAFEGYYQGKGNPNNYLKFTAKEDQLLLTQVWDGRQILFSPESDVDFFCKDFPFPLKFTKDKNGTVTEVLAFNRDVWVKDNNYKPVVKKTITLTPAQLKIFEGKYQLQQNKDIIVQITAVEDHLSIKQLWDGKELDFVAETELAFFAKDNPLMPIRFIKDKDGAITQIIAFDRDTLDKMKE
jgi:CubicO group peptidase (beta-lactamase class C family)